MTANARIAAVQAAAGAGGDALAASVGAEETGKAGRRVP